MNATKIAVLMLSFNRFELMADTLEKNTRTAGVDFDLFALDNGSSDIRCPEFLSDHCKGLIVEETNIGLAAGFNKLLYMVQDYDYIMITANDIIEPENWLIDRIEASVKRPGMVAIAVEDGKVTQVIQDVIGQWMISREVFEKVGYFCEDYGMYGPIDLDYNYRVRAAGFPTYYIPGRAFHIDQQTEYGYDKLQLIEQSWGKFHENMKRYRTNPYLDYTINTINQQQFYGEN